MLIYSDERQSTWDIGDTNYTPHNYSIKDRKEVKLANFQYKNNNKILLTNSFLFKIKKNNACSYCNEHLFLYCTKVKDFWNSLQD